MMRAIIFGCLIAIALAADKETCEHKGKLYKKGDRFMDDCNRCFCGGNDMVGCTKMMCRSHHAGQYSNMEADKETCEHKGKLYKKGDTFMDDCNRCFCGGNDMVGCTKMACRPHHAGQYSNMEADKETCEHKGKLYKKGDRFMDDCNHCFCGGNDMVGCTKMACPHFAGQYSNMEVDKETCEHKGKLYKKGDRFMDDCNHCFCGGNDMVGCTKMMCRSHHAGQYSNMEADKETCEHKGKLYKKGDRFMDDCNRCFCGGNDMVGCTKMICRPHHAGQYSNMESDKETCEHKGKLYKKGDTFMDDCNRCFCGGNDMVGCTKMACRPHHAGQYSNMEADKETCEHKGKLYKKGDRFMDDCNRCFCGGNDMVGCTKMICRPRHGGQYSNMEGTAVDSETCNFQGKMYKRGESFKNDCNVCFCGGNNVVGCTLMMCRPKHQDQTYEIETCKLHGKVYNFGDNFMNDCNKCFCGSNGNIACTEMLCIHKAQQLTEQKTCTQNGKTYNLGDHFMNDCNKCFCGVNGNIGCTQMMCIHPEKSQYSNSETCTAGGKVYKKGDHFSLDGGCNTCFCGGNDMVGCTRKLCVRKGCYHDGKLYKFGENFNIDCNGCRCTKNGAMCTKKGCLHKKPQH